MSSLRARFATLDSLPMPELWPEVEHRANALGSAERPTSVTIRTLERPSRSADRRLAVVAAVALLVALFAGAVAVGTGLVRVPVIVPAPAESPSLGPSADVSPSSAPSVDPTASPSITAERSDPASGVRSPWIVFRRGGDPDAITDRSERLWAMRADGTGAHEIHADSYQAIGWSQDGTRLLLNNGRILVAAVGEEIGPFVDTGVEVPVNEQWEAFDFSPDNEHVVFVHKYKCAAGASRTGSASPVIVLAVFTAETAGANCYVLTTLDLRTGKRVDLNKTLVRDQTGGLNLALELPAWSPDGAKIAYTRLDESRNVRELWVVNADGASPSTVGLEASVSVIQPRWSPDGTRISFTSERTLSESSGPGLTDSAVFVVDPASGRLERVTAGPGSADQQLCCAEWIDDDHLRVAGVGIDTNRFWLVALDGAGQEASPFADLTDSLARLGKPNVIGVRSAPGDPGRTFYWQPVPAAQP